MKIDVLTLFPEMFHMFREWSIIGRAVEADHVAIEAHNIRDYSLDKHRKVDDYPYGGGHGMVMMPQPAIDAIMDVTTSEAKVIYLSPKGLPLTQQKLTELAMETHLVLLCGHYEGLDQRIIDYYVDEEISLGDYVLTGGELPAMVLIDGITRLLPGVLSAPEAYEEESHYHGLLEQPQYTRPANYHGLQVPEVLLTGHHVKIEDYRMRERLRITYLMRPDLLQSQSLSDKEQAILDEIIQELEGRELDGSH